MPPRTRREYEIVEGESLLPQAPLAEVEAGLGLARRDLVVREDGVVASEHSMHAVWLANGEAHRAPTLFETLLPEPASATMDAGRVVPLHTLPIALQLRL